MAYMDYMELLIHYPRMAIKFDHPLAHCYQAKESDTAGRGFQRLMPASDLLTHTTNWVCFFFYTVF